MTDFPIFILKVGLLYELRIATFCSNDIDFFKILNRVVQELGLEILERLVLWMAI